MKEWYQINRLKCTNKECGKLHNELPDCLSPYKHYDAGLIEDVVDDVVTEDDTETENYPCADTMNHWKFWVGRNEGSAMPTLDNFVLLAFVLGTTIDKVLILNK